MTAPVPEPACVPGVELFHSSGMPTLVWTAHPGVDYGCGANYGMCPPEWASPEWPLSPGASLRDTHHDRPRHNMTVLAPEPRVSPEWAPPRSGPRSRFPLSAFEHFRFFPRGGPGSLRGFPAQIRCSDRALSRFRF
jgi:hypothetical protein